MVARVGAGVRVCSSLLAGLAPLLAAAPAAAQNWEIPGFDTAGVGIFLGYAFGGQHGERGLEWGVEGFATHFTHDVRECSSERRAGLGPLLRLSVLGLSRVAVTGALHGGGEFARALQTVDGEFGGTIAYQDGGARGGLHTGLTLESLYWNVYARQEWLLPSYSFGGGMRVLPAFGEAGFCAEGRLFRGERGTPRLARASACRKFDLRSPDAARWAQRASEECASVPAFLQLARELAELSAPAELVKRALSAAAEEVGHTRAAASLAAHYGGARVLLNPPPLRFRARLPRALALRRLAKESWHDGYLNEGLAARIARAELREGRASEETSTLALIEREEAGHASLALDTLTWALEQAPALVRSLQLPAETSAETPTPSSLPAKALRALADDNRMHARSQLRALSS